MVDSYNHKMISLARESRGISQIELSEKTSIPQSTLSKLENGFQQMDIESIKSLATVLDYPESFFNQNIVQYPPNLHYRKKSNIPAMILAKAEATMNIFRANISKLLKSLEINTDVPQFREPDPIAVARQLRAAWKVEKGPIQNLTALLESKGIIIMECEFDSDKIDGRSMNTEYGHPIIFLSANNTCDRDRMTMAHELGHIVMHLYDENIFDRDIEAEAFDFAGEFLMPQDEIRMQVPLKVTIPALADLKRVWKVSMAGILKWIEKIGCITGNQARYLWSCFNAQRIRRIEPIEIPKESSTLLRRIVDAHLEKLGYTIQELANLLCFNESEFRKIYVKAKIIQLKI